MPIRLELQQLLFHRFLTIEAKAGVRVNTMAAVENFLAQKTIALVGASRNPKKFSSAATKELRERGYKIVPVNPKANTIDGEHCYPSLSSIDEPVEAALVMVPKTETQRIVEDAAAAGIRHLWIQQGAETKESAESCRAQDISVIEGECILMFAGTKGFHKIHHWFNKLFGRLPS